MGLIVSAVACAYAGDGDYRPEGRWPFRSYRLLLPRLPFEEGVTRFSVRRLAKISDGGPYIALTLFPQSPAVCTRVDGRVSVELLDRSGELIAAGEGPLNALVERVNRAGTVRIPSKVGEWQPARLRYADEGIASKVTPLEPGVDSLPQEACLFLARRPWSERLRRVDAVVVRVAASRTGDALQVELSDGWK